MIKAGTSQVSLHRYSGMIDLVDILDDDYTPGRCPDCGTDIGGPLSAVPLPDAVPGEFTRGWYCEECGLSVVSSSSEHEQLVGGWTGWRVVEVPFRDGVVRSIAVPEGGDDADD